MYSSVRGGRRFSHHAEPTRANLSPTGTDTEFDGLVPLLSTRPYARVPMTTSERGASERAHPEHSNRPV
ncbi:hypothetical protein CYV19_14650 [Natronobacterium gregoryi SP2]|uniref:Uncharacterized protein n=1 Tax=Natronobacterium gregoryi (strain ATCC 43098 / DSM 3393 / CCM 3738 / CIP 104747 / IAM 13177 / JCM 8860 / NBRC 102187 / NCIMB 2189 / SP2) TaxID=797304 RepID=L9XXH5_NATGS|nr:hypothetical protein C490_13244 [Natronobacterium gregoryi SP2]PLK19494.1 hypothetical protein CYV19_14650 [Natronobacterium gregoryi SP2]